MAKKEYELLEFTIPNWALSSLINGDDSGLEEEDIEKLDKFVKETVAEYGNANFMLPRDEEMDLGFKRWNDIDNLGSDCSLLYLRPSKEYSNGGETDDDDMEEDENEKRLQELADEYDIPTEVIEEYANDRGIEISEITDLPYNGRYDSEEAYAEQMVDDGVITDLSYYLYMYPTDMRLLAQEEADRRVDDMDDDDLLSEADMEDEANEYSENQDEIDELRDEIRDLQTEIDDLFEDEDEDTTEGELQGKEEKAKELREELEDKENELERLEDRLASLDNYAEVVDKAREQLREEYYDEIYDALEKDAVGYFVDELGYNVEDLANNSGFSVDYEKLASELGYDVNYIHHEGEVYVFSNYERGGMTYAKGGEVVTLTKTEKNNLKNIFRSISRLEDDLQTLDEGDEGYEENQHYINLIYDKYYKLRSELIKKYGNSKGLKDAINKVAFDYGMTYAKGGFVEHGLEIGDKIISHKLKDDTIIVENNFRHEKARVDLEKGKRTLIERDKNKYAKGGGIPNNYRGKTTDDIWNMLTENQRIHFLLDHAEEVGIDSREITKIFKKDWDELDENIKDIFKTHTMMGQYAKGGGIPKSYTHFIVRKSDNKIINGYDYKGVDADDIKYYTKEDFKDMEISSKDFTLLTKKSLESKGINPYDESNWTNSYADGGMMAKGGVTYGRFSGRMGKYAQAIASYIDRSPNGITFEELGRYLKKEFPSKTFTKQTLYAISRTLYKTKDYLIDDDKDWKQSVIKNKTKMSYGSGGVTFDEKVSSISKALLKRKKVSPSVQKDYGKTYSKKEAIESAKRIAGAMRKKESAKKKS